MFLQVHTLTSYHASLLNRDDAGLAKRITFGGSPRIRISSQCLKRHWRDVLMSDNEFATGIRSTQIFEQKVVPGLVAAGVPKELAESLTSAFMKQVVKGSFDDRNPLHTKQPIFLGNGEVRYIVDFLKDLATQAGVLSESAAGAAAQASTETANTTAVDAGAKQTGKKQVAKKPAAKALSAIESLMETALKGKDAQKNFGALLTSCGDGNLLAGVETALFGRFVTSDLLARTEAACAVAHSFTVHAAEPEADFFSVVDDLGGDTGADHIGESELNAALFYGYEVVDIAQLVANVTGCAPSDWKQQDQVTAKQIAARLVELIATVSPGAKKGATAPFAYADFVLLEVGTDQPRSLANAFLRALPAREHRGEEASQAIVTYLSGVDQMYATNVHRFVSTTLPLSSISNATHGPLAQSIDTALQKIFQ